MPIYDINNNPINHGDVENRLVWYIHGERKEESFVRIFQNQLNVIINPEKEYNRMAIDLINPTTNLLIDLKTANTPFFTAERNYGISPQFAVTLNEIDVRRYQEYYPGMTIYFWVDWIAVKYVSPNQRYTSNSIEVEPMQGVWSISLQQVVTMIQNEEVPLHGYINRQNDQRGNAQESYVLDLRHPSFQRLV